MAEPGVEGRRHRFGRWISVDDKVRVKGFREEETHHEVGGGGGAMVRLAAVVRPGPRTTGCRRTVPANGGHWEKIIAEEEDIREPGVAHS
jgi:hypothetical protein